MKKSINKGLIALSIFGIVLASVTYAIGWEDEEASGKDRQGRDTAIYLLESQLGLYHTSLYANYYLEYENVRIREDATFFDSENQAYPVRELFASPKIVFRFSSQNCGECLLHEFELLKELIAENEKSHFLILGDYEKNELLWNMAQDAPEGVRCLNDQDGDFPGLPVNQHNLPYFVRVGSDLKVSNLMMLEKSFDRFTEQYLSMARTQFQ